MIDPMTGELSNIPSLNEQSSNPVEELINPSKSELNPFGKGFETGDIILFSDKTFIPSRLIEYFTDSKYSHIGVVLKDPIYINPSFMDIKSYKHDESCKYEKGLYILESTGLSSITDIEDSKCKFGVQIRKLEDVCKNYDGAIFWRKLNTTRDNDFYTKISEIHKIVHGKPYDINPIDWISTLFDVNLGTTRLTNRFFCSALVAYIYTKLGFISDNTHWSIIRPKDFGTESQTNNRIQFTNCTLDDECIIKVYDSYVHYIYSTY
jgi:hypothetical protein